MKKAFIKLHLSILLAGGTGVFGKIISLNEGLLVWYRMLFTSILFGVLLLVSKKLQKVTMRDFLKIGSLGFLLSLHWIFFYASIKASNVSVGVLCFSLTGFFTAILEPLIFRRAISMRELLFSLITVTGIGLIFSFDMRYRDGILLGVVSSCLAALFTICNKKTGVKFSSGTLLLYQMVGGFIAISALMPVYLKLFPVESMLPSVNDMICMFFFVVFCTIGMYMLQIQALKQISAFTVNLSYNLEPVYSIIIAMLFLGEAHELAYSFYAGLVLIMISVLLQMYYVAKENRRVPALES